jgi:hypothetical protein
VRRNEKAGSDTGNHEQYRPALIAPVTNVEKRKSISANLRLSAARAEVPTGKTTGSYRRPVADAARGFLFHRKKSMPRHLVRDFSLGFV